MDKEAIINLSVVPASEVLSHIVLDLFETAQKAREVIFQKENFRTFSTYLEKTSNILREFSNKNLDRSESLALNNAIEILEGEVKAAKELVEKCRERSKVYLLVNCLKIVKRIESCTKEISRALSLIPLASLGISSSVNGRIAEVCKDMLEAEFRANVAEEEILEKIELGIKERNCARSYANELLLQIAKALGLSTEQSVLKGEYKEFKREIEEAKLRKEEEESMQMDQIIALLEKADATTSSEEKEKKYLERRNSLGSQKLAPLQGFYCKLTQDVMVDPVETSSGQTFERSAIEKWIAEGNTLCPLTCTPLDVSALRPNRTLRQSIEEWRDRNTIITIASLKPKLQSEDEEEVTQSLSKLRDLCVQSESYREWVTMEDYIPLLIELLRRKNREIRNNALVILSILAKHREENKEKIANIDNALESIVRSLMRQHEERKSALQLLLELSRSNVAQSLIGNVHGCILLLVTMLSSDDNEVARDAEELIGILSYLEQNVKQMAKTNYFKPLLPSFFRGPEDVRMSMAETLSEIELTDHSKLSIVKDGVVRPLIQMLLEDDLEKKKVAVKCLAQLSSLPQNGLIMLEEGAVRPLFEILYRHSLQLPALREQVAATIMNLASAATSQEPEAEQFRILESEDDVFKFFSLVSLMGPETKRSILKAFFTLCQSHSGIDIRTKLRQISAVRVLVQLFEGENQPVRANAVKLFCCLTKDRDDSTLLEHVNQKCIETLLNIIQTSNDAEEISAALGIIANLPKVPQMTQWLLDAGALQIIHACLTTGHIDPSYRGQVEESAVEALCRFTVSTNQEWQTRVAEAGIIQALVQFLATGTTRTKQSAAVALKQLSESSKSLSKPVKKLGVFQCCVSASQTSCLAHSGICGVESSFCIIEANAVDFLVRMLRERDLQTCEAAFDALLTLVDAQKPQDGIKVLDKANAISPIIKLLSSDSVGLQGKCLKCLEMIFQVDELKGKYGRSAQMPLVDITQKKDGELKEIKALAAKLLSRLGVLGAQSSFF